MKNKIGFKPTPRPITTVYPDTVDNLQAQLQDAIDGLHELGYGVQLTGLYVNKTGEDVVVKAGHCKEVQITTNYSMVNPFETTGQEGEVG